jgi:hypothetical protein
MPVAFTTTTEPLSAAASVADVVTGIVTTLVESTPDTAVAPVTVTFAPPGAVVLENVAEDSSWRLDAVVVETPESTDTCIKPTNR